MLIVNVNTILKTSIQEYCIISVQCFFFSFFSMKTFFQKDHRIQQLFYYFTDLAVFIKNHGPFRFHI